jgi:hypothetical protein
MERTSTTAPPAAAPWIVTAFAGLAGAAVLAFAVLWFTSARAPAADKHDPNKPTKGDQDPPPAKEEPRARSPQSLPISQVVLYSSGVGYFLREGTVDGDARIDLSFQAADINDLLKSMVVQDLDGGRIATVSYDSKDPIEKTLKSYAVNLTSNPSFAQILNQARGEKVEAVLTTTQANQPGTLNGTIVGVEHQKVAAGKDAVEVEVLNLWCADGVRAVKLSDIQRLRFLSPVMEGEFKKALETLALSHDTQKKAVSLSFSGEGKRNVRVGYVVENPIWKTSYRLVLDKENKAAPQLQGWAVVENPTDEDWKDVRMALVSGRPISFQMNLYDPLYVSRPVVEPELFASLRPVAYSGALRGNNEGFARAAQPTDDKPSPFGGPGGPQGKGKDHDLRLGLRPSGEEQKAFKQLEERMDLGKGVQAMASATKLGDFFQYLIDRPVSLPRQKSAMLPIVQKDIEAARVSIYNERTQAKFPLLGLRLKNTSGLHLMQGPITVFEGSSYAGDARILDLQPKEERLISFAVDLGTEVSPAPATSNGKIIQIKVVKGLLHSKTKIRDARTYTVVNRNDKERAVLLEHPVRKDFTLVGDDKPVETADDVYRFQLKVAPGKTETRTVTEEKEVSEAVQLTSSNDDQLRWFMSQTVSSDKVKAGLKQAIDLRWALNKTQREIGELKRQLDTIVQDQGRLRANLREMPPTAAAYKRYLEKFDAQEVEIEKYQADIKKLQGVEHAQQKEFEDFLANFSAD